MRDTIHLPRLRATSGSRRMGSRRRVERVSWFSRIRESIRGMVFGLILFVGSFPLLWLNEGCAVDDYEAWDHMAARALQVESSRSRERGQAGPNFGRGQQRRVASG